MTWVSTRLKFLAEVPITNGLGESGAFDDPTWPRYIRTTDIAGPSTLRNDTFASLPPEIAERAMLRLGDIVMTAAGATIGKSCRYTVDKLACYAGFLVRFRAKHGIDSRFISYWTESVGYWDQIQTGKVVSTIENFSASKYQNLHLEVPSAEKQRAIADYLDTEMIRIDALITKKLRMIDVSRERQVVSESAAVLATGSQATPIPTIPTIPATWRVLRNKVFMREVNAPSLDGTEEMLSVSHITGVTPRSEKTVNMFEAESTTGYKTVQPGDLVINTMWAWMGAAGVARVSGIVSPAYGVYRIDPNIMTPDYFDIVVRTSAYITEMTRYSRGVTSSRLRLYPDEFLSLSSPVPPLGEQRRIVELCFAERVRTAALVERLERQIKLLREHRQALITAVIAGDIEIQEVAA
jgi:type I restriction enzyme S subunit